MPCQAHQEAAEGIGRHRLHLAPQAGQRAAAQGAQHFGVGELVLGAAGPEGALQQDALLHQGAEALLDARRGNAPASRRRIRREGAVGARPAQQQGVERRGVVAIRGLQPRLGHAGRWAGAEGIAVAGHVLDRDPSTLARQTQLDDAPIPGQPGQRDLDLGQVRARCHLIGPQVADAPQKVVQPVHRTHPPTPASACSSSSRSVVAAGSSSSRSSSAPSSSASSSRSSESACARRSASGASPSYM